MTVLWTRDGNLPPSNSNTTRTGNTTTLLIENPQPSNAGDYLCVFSELNLQRLITLG